MVLDEIVLKFVLLLGLNFEHEKIRKQTKKVAKVLMVMGTPESDKRLGLLTEGEVGCKVLKAGSFVCGTRRSIWNTL